MTKIVERSLPHAISSVDVKDPTVKQKVMLLVENLNSLKAQLAESQRAIVELQRSGSSSSDPSSASSAVQMAKDYARQAKASEVGVVEQVNSAKSYAGDARSYANSAQGYSESASASKETAGQYAAIAQANANTHAICLVFKYVALTGNYSTFHMKHIVGTENANVDYTVSVAFVNTTTTRRDCTVNDETVSIEGKNGAENTKSITVKGSETFKVNNLYNSVNVYIRITEKPSA